MGKATTLPSRVLTALEGAVQDIRSIAGGAAKLGADTAHSGKAPAQPRKAFQVVGKTKTRSVAVSQPAVPATGKAPDIASASVPDTLAKLHVDPAAGLTRAEVDVRRKTDGYNEVAEQ